jgi:futalosine hydrolase
MKVLIVAATIFELGWFSESGVIRPSTEHCGNIVLNNISIPYAITGMGVVNTLINLPQIIYEEQPDLLINVGLCGSAMDTFILNRTYALESDCFADVSIIREDKHLFLHSDGTAASEPEVVFPSFNISQHIFEIESVPGITVSSFYNVELSKRPGIYSHFNTVLESMEGAAVFRISEGFGIKVCGLRTLSNYVWQNVNEWNIPESVKANNMSLMKLLNVIL